jgi:hypothetical protein
LADAYNALHDEELSMFPDAYETLDRLKELGVKMSSLSATLVQKGEVLSLIAGGGSAIRTTGSARARLRLEPSSVNERRQAGRQALGR